MVGGVIALAGALVDGINVGAGLGIAAGVLTGGDVGARAIGEVEVTGQPLAGGEAVGGCRTPALPGGCGASRGGAGGGDTVVVRFTATGGGETGTGLAAGFTATFSTGSRPPVWAGLAAGCFACSCSGVGLGGVAVVVAGAGARLATGVA